MKKLDFIIIAVLLVLCLSAFLFYRLYFGNEGSFVTITVNGTEYTQLPLSSDCELNIPSADGYNLLLISNGEASVTDASCPDGICINHKAIRNDGETIICLPNKVIIEITAD